MTTSNLTRRRNSFGPGLDAAAVVARWLLGAIFLFLGLNKALDPVDFLKLLHQYDLPASPLILNSIAAWLPWFEVFCGILLLLGVAVQGAALALLAMLIPFTYVVLHRALALHALLGIPLCAVRFDCGCGNGEILACRKLVENVALIGAAAWLLAGRGRRVCIRHSLRQKSASEPA